MMRIQVLLVHRAVAAFLALNSTDDTGAHLGAPTSTLLGTLSVFLLARPSLTQMSAALIVR